MKFAIAVALFVLGQCIIADAWYVRCSTFQNFVNQASRDRNSVRSTLNSVSSSYSSYRSRMNGYNSDLSKVESERSRCLSSSRSFQGCLVSDFRKLRQQASYLDGYQRRIDRICQMNKCLYGDEPVLRCLFLESEKW